MPSCRYALATTRERTRELHEGMRPNVHRRACEQSLARAGQRLPGTLEFWFHLTSTVFGVEPSLEGISTGPAVLEWFPISLVSASGSVSRLALSSCVSENEPLRADRIPASPSECPYRAPALHSLCNSAFLMCFAFGFSRVSSCPSSLRALSVRRCSLLLVSIVLGRTHL